MSKNIRYSAPLWSLIFFYSLSLQSFAQRPSQLELELEEEHELEKKELVKETSKDLQKKQEKGLRYIPAILAATACAVGGLAVYYSISTKPIEEKKQEAWIPRRYSSLGRSGQYPFWVKFAYEFEHAFDNNDTVYLQRLKKCMPGFYKELCDALYDDDNINWDEYVSSLGQRPTPRFLSSLNLQQNTPMKILKKQKITPKFTKGLARKLLLSPINLHSAKALLMPTCKRRRALI